MSNLPVYGVILAGGSGSRLWPLSREMTPKQLIKLNSKYTFFQSTFLRLTKTIDPKNILTVANTKHSTDIKTQLGQLKEVVEKVDAHKVLIEPIGRNTAPAIGMAALYVLNNLTDCNEDAIVLVAPSDHLIYDEETFSKAILEGVKLAEQNYIVTFGVKPTKPDTGYGYINTQASQEIAAITDVAQAVTEFKEKPELSVAEEYCRQGTYYWNAGIFMFKASVFMEELKNHSNEIYEKLSHLDFKDIGASVPFDDYVQIPDISVDYAVMEKTDRIALIPIDCGWNDLGSWEAIYDISEKDEKENFVSGKVVSVDTEGSFVFSTSKLVSTIGVKDLVIVETDDALLVCDKSKTQDVKKVYNQLKANKDNTYLVHKTVYRPWGYYTVMSKADGFQVKTIAVMPGAKLSYQMHYHRNEHWTVLEGTAKVIKDGKEYFLKPGDSVDIPATVKHALENPGRLELKIIEIQHGSYLEEDDIVRFTDIYGRV